MGIAGHKAIAVIDLDQIAVAGVDLGVDDYTARGGGDGRADVGREVQARVQGTPAGEGVGPEAEPRSDRSHDRCRAGHQQLGQTTFQQTRLDQREQVGGLVGTHVQRGHVGAQDFHRHPFVQAQSGNERTALSAPRGTGRARRHGPGSQQGLELLRLDAREPGHPVTHRLELEELGLHLSHARGHGIEVLAQETVALGRLVPDEQGCGLRHHGPPVTHGPDQNEVVDDRRQSHQCQRPGHQQGPDLYRAQLQHAGLRQAAVGNHDLHRPTLLCMGNRKLASPAVPLPQPVSGALARNETLAGLALRMAESGTGKAMPCPFSRA
jgi:hypothetical protein